MRRLTAIVHLNDTVPPIAREFFDVALRPLPGVIDYDYMSDDAVLSVRYDHDLTGVAEIVRVIEDGGTTVSSIAQRL